MTTVESKQGGFFNVTPIEAELQHIREYASALALESQVEIARNVNSLLKILLTQQESIDALKSEVSFLKYMVRENSQTHGFVG